MRRIRGLTGPLHLGNLHGALANWKNLQDEYECFFFIADWHALTTDYDDTEGIKENSINVFLDWLSVGLSPEKCTLFVQSYEKEHAGKKNIVEQIIRPTGLVDPPVEVRPTEHQIDDLLEEIRKTFEKKERVLITTLTKKSAEKLNEFLRTASFKSLRNI